MEITDIDIAKMTDRPIFVFCCCIVWYYYAKTLLFVFFFFTYKNKLKLQKNGSKKIKVRFTISYKAMQFLEDSCIRSVGLLDEWACHSCKNALCVLLRPQ